MAYDARSGDLTPVCSHQVVDVTPLSLSNCHDQHSDRAVIDPVDETIAKLSQFDFVVVGHPV